jgi:Zn-dependent peptidase ImmA (M78 family)
MNEKKNMEKEPNIIELTPSEVSEEVLQLRKKLSDYGITEPINNDNQAAYFDFMKENFKIPDEVFKFAEDNCLCLFFENHAGCCVWLEQEKPGYLIIINYLQPEECVYVLAHEIAHAWLGHKSMSKPTIAEKNQEEKETSDKVKEWGVPITDIMVY